MAGIKRIKMVPGPVQVCNRISPQIEHRDKPVHVDGAALMISLRDVIIPALDHPEFMRTREGFRSAQELEGWAERLVAGHPSPPVAGADLARLVRALEDKSILTMPGVPGAPMPGWISRQIGVLFSALEQAEDYVESSNGAPRAAEEATR